MTTGYATFLSHHKGGGAVYARLVKMQLQQDFGFKSVFLDSDNLDDLDKVCDTVKDDTDFLTVLLTAETLQRPWCAAELVSALRNQVPIVALAFPGYEKPGLRKDNRGFCAWWSGVNWSALNSYGIEERHVLDCYEHFATLEATAYPVRAAEDEQHSALATSLVGVSSRFRSLLGATSRVSVGEAR